jgi:ABC-type antimicrobial peptide transport system permease subunit
LPYIEVQPLSDLLEPQLRRWRVGARVLTALGLLSIGLALLGLYGVIAHAMARRTFELGVRFALGAQRRQVAWLALKQGIVIALTGCAGGLLIVLGGARFLQPLLFQVSAADPLILSAVAMTVIAIAAFASYAPSRRAAHLDPAAVLRVD